MLLSNWKKKTTPIHKTSNYMVASLIAYTIHFIWTLRCKFLSDPQNIFLIPKPNIIINLWLTQQFLLHQLKGLHLQSLIYIFTFTVWHYRIVLLNGLARKTLAVKTPNFHKNFKIFDVT